MDTELLTEEPAHVIAEAFSRTVHLASEEEVHAPGSYDLPAHSLKVHEMSLNRLLLGLSRLDHCLVNPQVK